MTTIEQAHNHGERRGRSSSACAVRGECGRSTGARVREGESEWGCRSLEMAGGGHSLGVRCGCVHDVRAGG
jgi:hypothetical protein